jgi:hypothetical protein
MQLLLHLWQFGMQLLLHLWQFSMQLLLHLWQFGMQLLLHLWQFSMQLLLHLWQFSMLLSNGHGFLTVRCTVDNDDDSASRFPIRTIQTVDARWLLAECRER